MSTAGSGNQDRRPARRPVLEVEGLDVTYTVHAGGLRNRALALHAVNRVSFTLARGETLGVVGESGAGKSTLARAVLGLTPVSAGRVRWRGEELTQLDAEQMRARRRELQLVFQDPVSALDPRMTIGEILREPLATFHPRMSAIQVRERVRGMLKMVGILPQMINRYPHEFSAGQCQRIGIARALILNPRLLVCDEPVSALDVSIQAQIIDLLEDLQRKLQLSMIFIAHDLSIVRLISDRVMVMYLGQVVELSPSDSLYEHPRHPYTQALIEAVPLPDPDYERAHADRGLRGEPPSPLFPPSGCAFHPRCPYAIDRCREERPELRPFREGKVRCHRAEALAEGELDEPALE